MTAYPKVTRRPKRQPAHVPPKILAELERRDGRRCAWTGETSDRLVPQHRQGGAGGRQGKHRLSNLLWLDSLINGLIESDAVMQGEAKRRGIKISLHAEPTLVPVLHAVHGVVFLTDDGQAVPVGEVPA